MTTLHFNMPYLSTCYGIFGYGARIPVIILFIFVAYRQEDFHRNSIVLVLDFSKLCDNRFDEFNVRNSE